MTCAGRSAGETANGAYPEATVRTMVRIVENAELCVDSSYHYDWIRRNNSGKVGLAGCWPWYRAAQRNGGASRTMYWWEGAGGACMPPAELLSCPRRAP